MGIDEKLGIVNLFVDQLGCKVVVIANDREIAERFDEKKEKLIGQTIRAEPHIDEAFEAFSSKLKDHEGAFVRNLKAKIVSTFKSSGRESLRVLKYVIDDFARLRSKLGEEFTKNDQAMTELAQLFTAIDIETRYGSLSEEDLRNRHYAYMVASMDEDKAPQSAIKLASDKYSPIDLTNTLISDDLAISMFIKGNYQSDEIEKSLRGSPYFSDPNHIPPWLGLYHFYKILPDEAQSFLDTVLDQINNSRPTAPGEILHSFALLLLMSKHNLIEMKKTQVVEMAKTYLKNLLENGKFAPKFFDRSHTDVRSGYGGYGFWVEADYLDELNEIHGAINSTQQEALERQFPHFAQELLQVMKTDVDEFYNDVCVNSTKAARFSELPVLACIPAKDFVDTISALHPTDRRMIASALKDRYEGMRFDNELAKEKPWITKVLQMVDERASAMTGFASLQLQMLFGSHFRERVTGSDSN